MAARLVAPFHRIDQSAAEVTDDRIDKRGAALPEWLEQRPRTIAVRVFLDGRPETCRENGVSLDEIGETWTRGKDLVHGAVEIVEVGKGIAWFRSDFAFVFREEQG